MNNWILALGDSWIHRIFLGPLAVTSFFVAICFKLYVCITNSNLRNHCSDNGQNKQFVGHAEVMSTPLLFIYVHVKDDWIY